MKYVCRKERIPDFQKRPRFGMHADLAARFTASRRPIAREPWGRSVECSPELYWSDHGFFVVRLLVFPDDDAALALFAWRLLRCFNSQSQYFLDIHSGEQIHGVSSAIIALNLSWTSIRPLRRSWMGNAGQAPVHPRFASQAGQMTLIALSSAVICESVSISARYCPSANNLRFSGADVNMPRT